MFSLLCFQTEVHLVYLSEGVWCEGSNMSSDHAEEVRLTWRLRSPPCAARWRDKRRRSHCEHKVKPAEIESPFFASAALSGGWRTGAPRRRPSDPLHVFGENQGRLCVVTTRSIPLRSWFGRPGQGRQAGRKWENSSFGLVTALLCVPGSGILKRRRLIRFMES